MNQPRWLLYGIIDGAIVGGGLPAAVMLLSGLYDSDLGPDLLGWALVGSLCGAAIGFVVGLLGGMAIDLLRQFGLDDRRAVAVTMVPFLCGVLVLAGTHRADGGFWLAVSAVAVAVDLCWRLSRLDRRTPTVLT